VTTAALSERGQTALRYAQRGLAVFPCFTAHEGACACGNPDCRNIGKHPIGALVPEGLKDPSTDPARISDWWARYPDANIAVRPWPQRFVIDIDRKHGGDTSWADLEATHGAVQTATTRTGSNGRHLWFTAPTKGVSIRSRTGVRPGIDVLAAGGYVIAAGSVNGSGRYYWDGSSAPVAPPAWLVDLVADTSRPKAPHAPTGAGERVSEGGRNAYLTRKAGQLRRPGFSVDAMFAALVQLNQESCEPPLEALEVRQIAESVGRYAPADEHTGSEAAPSWRLLDDAQLMTLPDPEWLVVDVAPRRGVGVIYGPSGGAKTTLVAQLCLSIATGRSFCGHDVRHRGACVYVATEDASGFKVRMRAAKIAAHLSLDLPVGVFTLPDAIDLRDPVKRGQVFSVPASYPVGCAAGARGARHVRRGDARG
jgi:hypothetical protein